MIYAHSSLPFKKSIYLHWRRHLDLVHEKYIDFFPPANQSVSMHQESNPCCFFFFLRKNENFLIYSMLKRIRLIFWLLFFFSLSIFFQVDLRHLQQTPDSDKIDVGIDLQDYYISVEWDIMKVPAERNEKYYSCCEEPYPDIIFNITLRRKTLFYTVSVNISIFNADIFYSSSVTVLILFLHNFFLYLIYRWI